MSYTRNCKKGLKINGRKPKMMAVERCHDVTYMMFDARYVRVGEE